MIEVDLNHTEGYFVGLDLGQATDHSALAVVARHVIMPKDPTMGPGPMPMYSVVYVKRFDLGTPWHVVEEMTDIVMHSDYLRTVNAELVVDKSGVGSPVVEALRRERGLACTAVVITSGETEAYQAEISEYHVPKVNLVTCLQGLVQRRRFQVFEDVEARKELFDELADFSYKVNKDTGRTSYEAASAKVHDDLVIAVSLATWFAETKRPASEMLMQYGQGGGGSDERNYDPLG